MVNSVDFKEIAKGIVEDSIVSVLCVDDNMAGPFQAFDQAKSGSAYYSMPHSLHQSFKHHRCHFSVYPFSDHESWKKTERFELSNRDLLILDWELMEGKSSAIAYGDSLKILASAIETTGIPFTYIYTQTKEISNIPLILMAYFSGISKAEGDALEKKILDAWEELEDIDDAGAIYENLKQPLLEHLRITDKDGKNAWVESVQKIIKDETDSNQERKLFGKMKGIVKKTLSNHNIGECIFMAMQANSFFPPEAGPQKEIEDFNLNGLTLIIDQNFIKIASKNEGDQAYVEPKNLFSDFTETVIQSQYNFLIFLALEFRSLYRHQAMEVGKNLHFLNEIALFQHLDKLGNDGRRFLKHLWKDQVAALWFEKESKMLEAIPSYREIHQIDTKVTDFEANPDHEALAKINYYYSTLQIQRKSGDKIRFGDIFEVNGQEPENKEQHLFFMCITPHCDCARPNKIDNLFTFVKGEKVAKNSTALRRGDEGFDSYLIGDDDKVYCIKWKTKPFSIFISDDDNNISSSIPIQYRNQAFEQVYRATQKESYAQRIANEATSYLMRVGIDLASIPKKDEDECDC